MKRYLRSMLVLGVASLALIGVGSNAQAAFDISILSTIITPAGGVVVGSGGNSTITITPPAINPLLTSAAPPTGTDFVVANTQTADLGVATTYTDNYNFNYQFDVTVTDLASSDSGIFSFTGNFQGTITGTGTLYQVNTTNFTTLITPTSQTLGGILYTVSLPPGFFAAGGPPAGPGLPGNFGTFTAHIVAAVPEPASMGLVGLGGLVSVAMFRRRKSAS